MRSATGATFYRTSLGYSEWMPRLAAEGVVGADAIFACLGPALEIFSRYSRVEKSDGSVVPLREYPGARLGRRLEGGPLDDLQGRRRERLGTRCPLDRHVALDHAPDPSGTNDNGSPEEGADEGQDAEDEDPQDRPIAGGGYAIEFDAVRKIARGWGLISTP